MRSRFLFILVMAVAMAMAPFAMSIGEAMAAAPAHHGGTSAGNDAPGHCSGEPEQEPADESGESCCAAGCFALATLEAPAAEAASLSVARERPAQQIFRRGYLGEIATPPPRIS
jgi:hypothetical protein